MRVRRATGGASNEDDDAYARLGAALRADERALVDAALAVAAVVQPGASRIERLEAIAQEFLGAYHGGHLRVAGRAPEGLSWYLNGEPWMGPEGAGWPTATSSSASAMVRPSPQCGPRPPAA